MTITWSLRAEAGLCSAKWMTVAQNAHMLLKKRPLKPAASAVLFLCGLSRAILLFFSPLAICTHSIEHHKIGFMELSFLHVAYVYIVNLWRTAGNARSPNSMWIHGSVHSSAYYQWKKGFSYSRICINLVVLVWLVLLVIRKHLNRLIIPDLHLFSVALNIGDSFMRYIITQRGEEFSYRLLNNTLL